MSDFGERSGTPHKRLENWLFAILGKTHSETTADSRVESALNDSYPGSGSKITAALVTLVRENAATLLSPPPDAHTLRAWSESLRTCFNR